MTCIGKDTFPSQRTAAQVAHRVQQRSYRQGKTVHRIHTYHCPLCAGWHVTGNNGDNLNKGNH